MSSTTYGNTEVGQAIETAPGSVVSSRIVNVSDEPGLVGAGIGYMAEKQMKDRDGIEYVLEMDDGRLVTLVQNRESDEQPLSDGARVLVQLNGQYTRVMAHPAVDYNAGGGGWVDPGAGTAPVPGAGPGAADPGGRNLLFQGSDVVKQPAKPAPPLTSTTGSGQQQ